MSNPVTAIGNAISELTKALNIWAKSKRIRYSLAANKEAHKFIKRVRKLYGDEDKQLRKYEKKFYKLTTSE